MGLTLAEAKDSLHVAQAQLGSHQSNCLKCRIVRKVADRCDEFHAIQAEIKQLRFDIRNWFAPHPDDPVLFEID